MLVFPQSPGLSWLLAQAPSVGGARRPRKLDTEGAAASWRPRAHGGLGRQPGFQAPHAPGLDEGEVDKH